jgi:hypothetical protein
VNEKTSKIISEIIINELELCDKDGNFLEWSGEKPEMLIQQLRKKKAKYLSQEVWVAVASYLEDNYKKSNKRPKEENYFRDQFIIEEYKKIKGTLRDSEIYSLIERMLKKKAADGIRPIGDSQIRKIVDEFKEEQKLADEFENNK